VSSENVPGAAEGVPVFWPVVLGFAEGDSSLGTKKPLRGEAVGRLARLAARVSLV